MTEIPDGLDLHDAPPEGYYSDYIQYWVIRPQAEWEYDAEREWLCLGGPGVDGLEFGIRKGQAGVFAYYPIDDDYVQKAPSVPELIRGLLDGSILL